MSIHLASLDITKVFDGVWHQPLLPVREHDDGRVVPQGSSLSPFLYALYTADSAKLPKVKTAHYADDVAIFATSFYSQMAVAKVQSVTVLPSSSNKQIY